MEFIDLSEPLLEALDENAVSDLLGLIAVYENGLVPVLVIACERLSVEAIARSLELLAEILRAELLNEE